MLLTLVAVSIAAYIVWTWICIELRIRQASSMAIPLVRFPIDSHNIPWQVIEAHIWKLVDALPIAWLSWPENIRFVRRGWHFFEKNDHHRRHGSIFAIVSGASTNVLVSDPDAVREILTRRKEFVRMVKNYKILDVFGPSISTADAKNWPRHRKAVAAPFNESVMGFVWDESIKQAVSMTKSWHRPEARKAGIASVQDDLRCVSLNVLAASAFRKSYAFQDSEAVKEETSYRATLQIILDNAIPLMLIPYKVLMAPMVPKNWRKIGQAGDHFKKYMVEMLEEETETLKRDDSGAGGFTTSLVKALEIFEKGSNADSSLAKGLSVEEYFGNMFVINFAGHDTSANTFVFAMMLLAQNIAVQEWVAEEIDAVTKSHAGHSEDMAYENIFPKLLRCRAILYETLRLFPPIMAIPRGTDSFPQTLHIQGRAITIPPDTDVTVSVLALHTSPTHWPNNPLKWDPTRWINTDGTFFVPKPFTFIPWSDGPQSCPGEKFATVEFVAVLCIVLGDKARLRAVPKEGERVEEAEERVGREINDVNMEMLLRMRDADRVRLGYKE